ncbi:hypothetical protein OZN62_13845 [Aurantiacibacter sp. MUD11]|uniref:hypothetical protein n=1 Tax=Aurantiacibacter sp. MUD11 TaxID=3003265 RepID=UPI0022AAD9D7|nr:hypothetical protein [Aurantiacibacter sp. MUD11]WAT17980.1 hypothetical protein OZN62_13845 [Aurantiacibacter sp. MUD11]
MPSMRERLPALAAMAVPTLAGAAWMAASGAPAHYATTNLAVLAGACGWMLVGRGPHTALSRHMLLATLLVIMLSPLAVGPEMTSVTGDRVVRWFPMGAINLHVGMFVVPSLVLLAARNRLLAAPILLAGLFIALLQPDAGSGFALTFAAIGIHHVTKDWKVGVTAIVGFVASVMMSLVGELPPQPFVERVFIDSFSQSLFVGLALALSLAAGFALLTFAAPMSRESRFALAGALFGFVAIAMMSHYPMPLIGYGAAPIAGFGLALGLHRIPQR